MDGGVAIIGGVGLILFGIRFLRKGLDRLFGGNLIAWLSRLAAKPWKAFAAGIGAGVVSPSSTGMSIMAVQLLGGGLLRAEGILAMLLGANVGMTVTVQLMAFRIQDYAGLMIAVGVASFLYAGREVVRGCGQCLLALGFIFLAIDLIGQGAQSITASEEAHTAFSLLRGHPLLIFGGTALLAVVLQSSTATIGLGVGLCASGMLGEADMVLWVLGTNVGVGLSSLIVGWGSLNARRLGVANLTTKLALALPLLWLPEVALWLFNHLPGGLVQQIVTYHTLFNLLVGLIALPLLTPVIRFAGIVVPAPDPALAQEETHLDPKALDTPSIALARATRETLRMADKVRSQMETFWRACRAGDAELARYVQRQDDSIDAYNRSLLSYLNRISGERSARDNRWQLTLMSFAMELESVGDLLEKHLCDLVIKQRDEVMTMTAADWRDLERIYHRVLSNFDATVTLLTLRDEDEALALAQSKHAFNEECRRLQQVHYARLQSGSGSELLGNTFFIDYLTGLRHINSHITGIAYSLAGSQGNAAGEDVSAVAASASVASAASASAGSSATAGSTTTGAAETEPTGRD